MENVANDKLRAGWEPLFSVAPSKMSSRAKKMMTQPIVGEGGVEEGVLIRVGVG